MLLRNIYNMLVERKEETEWRGDFLYIASKITVPSVILNACSAKMDPPVSEREFLPRGISFYNPGGGNGRRDTLCLVLGPTIGKEFKSLNSSTDNATMSKGKLPLIRPDLISSYQRLNMLRCLLHLYPFSSTLDGFGQLSDDLKRFIKADKETHRVYCADEYEKFVELCPIQYDSSTFQVLLKMCPEHMRSLFELRFIIRTKMCTCKETEPDKKVAITSVDINCSEGTVINAEERFLRVFQRMQRTCCFSARHDFEIQNAPPILAVHWNPGSENSEVCNPRLDISLTKVFKSGNSEDLTYQLVSICSGKRGKLLWSAHCKSYQTGRWKMIKDQQNIRNYNWADTCRVWNHKHRLQLFYVKTSAIPCTSEDINCLSEGRWVQAKCKAGKAVHPAQIVRIWRIPDKEIQYKVNWDDNDQGDALKVASDLFPLLDVVDKIPKFQIGDRVMVQKGSAKTDDKIFPAVISRCFTNYQYLITWDDGDKTCRVHNEKAIQHRNASPAKASFQEYGRNEAVQSEFKTTKPLEMPKNDGVSTKATEGGPQAMDISDENGHAFEKEASDCQAMQKEKLQTPRIRSTRRKPGISSSDEEMDDVNSHRAQSSQVLPGPARTEQHTAEFKDPALTVVRAMRSQYQTEHDKKGAVHVTVELDFFMVIKFCSSGIHTWFVQVQRCCPPSTLSHMRSNAAVMFFVEDLEFVQHFRSQFDIDLHSIDSVRHLPSLQLNAENNDISLFDSNNGTITLPDGVLRLVAIKFSQLKYGSSTGIVLLIQMKLFGDESVFLVSVDTSFDRKANRKCGLPVRMKRIEELGGALIRALTTFNSKMSDAPIPTLHIPVIPKKLKIKSRVNGKNLTRALVAGMAQEHNQSSPTVTMENQE